MKVSYLLFFTFLLTAILFVSCSDSRDYDTLAEEVCACMSDMAELDKQYRANEGAGNVGESLAMSAEMQYAMEEAENCMSGVEEENEVGDIRSDIAFMDAIRRECPDAAAMMDNYEE